LFRRFRSPNGDRNRVSQRRSRARSIAGGRAAPFDVSSATYSSTHSHLPLRSGIVPQVPVAEWRSEPRESKLVAGSRPSTSRAPRTARRIHVVLCDVVQRQDARLLTGRRWFESSRRSLATPCMPRSSNGRGRRSLTPEARVRFPLGVLHSTPSDASGDATRLSAGRGGFDSRRGRSSRRSSVVSTTLLPWRHGGSTPPGETASHG
jgi:hypothetical protein